jgi:hypothetical protein
MGPWLSPLLFILVVNLHLLPPPRPLTLHVLSKKLSPSQKKKKKKSGQRKSGGLFGDPDSQKI